MNQRHVIAALRCHLVPRWRTLSSSRMVIILIEGALLIMTLVGSISPCSSGRHNTHQSKRSHGIRHAQVMLFSSTSSPRLQSTLACPPEFQYGLSRCGMMFNQGSFQASLAGVNCGVCSMLSSRHLEMEGQDRESSEDMQDRTFVPDVLSAVKKRIPTRCPGPQSWTSDHRTMRQQCDISVSQRQSSIAV